MESEINYKVVGAFVLLLLTAIIVAIVWLSAGISFTRYNTYRVYMTESVSGLTQDAQVEYNGVQVGAVKQISLDEHNPHLVQLTLKVDKTTPITVSTVATLNTRGLTGITYVALKDTGKDTRPLTETPGQPYPVIKTAPSLFSRLDNQISKLSDNLNKVSISIQQLLNQENLHTINQILINTEALTKTITTTAQRLNPLIQSTTSSMQAFNTETLPSANRAIYNLDLLTRNLSAITAEIKQNPAAIVRGVQPEKPGPGENYAH